jgi:hypothetical protein
MIFSPESGVVGYSITFYFSGMEIKLANKYLACGDHNGICISLIE